MSDLLSLVEPYRRALIGLPVSHVWNGHGSALFLEFGALTPHVRKDGTPGEPDGEMGLMVEWSWRIEQGAAILCGSWSDEALWRPAFERLMGRAVVDVRLFGRLPEIEIVLGDDLRVLSFMTAAGEPCWVLFDRRGARNQWLCVEAGRVQAQATPEDDAPSA